MILTYLMQGSSTVQRLVHPTCYRQLEKRSTNITPYLDDSDVYHKKLFNIVFSGTSKSTTIPDECYQTP